VKIAAKDVILRFDYKQLADGATLKTDHIGIPFFKFRDIVTPDLWAEINFATDPYFSTKIVSKFLAVSLSRIFLSLSKSLNGPTCTRCHLPVSA